MDPFTHCYSRLTTQTDAPQPWLRCQSKAKQRDALISRTARQNACKSKNFHQLGSLVVTSLSAEPNTQHAKDKIRDRCVRASVLQINSQLRPGSRNISRIIEIPFPYAGHAHW